MPTPLYHHHNDDKHFIRQTNDEDNENNNDHSRQIEDEEEYYNDHYHQQQQQHQQHYHQQGLPYEQHNTSSSSVHHHGDDVNNNHNHDDDEMEDQDHDRIPPLPCYLKDMLQVCQTTLMKAFHASFHIGYIDIAQHYGLVFVNNKEEKDDRSTKDDPSSGLTNDGADSKDKNMTTIGTNTEPKKKKKVKKIKKKVLFGHKERILGCDISDCQTYVATASQDSTIKIWNLQNQQLVTTLPFNKDHEVLRVLWAPSTWGTTSTSTSTNTTETTTTRTNDSTAFASSSSSSSSSNDNNKDDEKKKTMNQQPEYRPYRYMLATGGADGVVNVYGANVMEDTLRNDDDEEEEDNNNTNTSTSCGGGSGWKRLQTFDHSTYEHFRSRLLVDEKDKPQIYSLQFFEMLLIPPSPPPPLDDPNDAPTTSTTTNTISTLLTTSDDHIHIWGLMNDQQHDQQQQQPYDFMDVKRMKLDTNDVQVGSANTSSSSLLVGRRRQKVSFHEMVSIRFTSNIRDYHTGYGTQICYVTKKSNTSTETIPPELHDKAEEEEIVPTVDSEKKNSNNNIFGGDRNPLRLVYIFEASYCHANGLLGVALSDGTIRLVDVSNVNCCDTVDAGYCGTAVATCVSILQLPGSDTHVTSFAWDSQGQNIAMCLGSGHLITWRIDVIHTAGTYPPEEYYNNNNNNKDVDHGLVVDSLKQQQQQQQYYPKQHYKQVRATWCSVYSGGHTPGKPLYGAKYIEIETHGTNTDSSSSSSSSVDPGMLNHNNNQLILLSWGSDGKICLWDGWAVDAVDAPISILCNNREYPIYAVAMKPFLVQYPAQQKKNTALPEPSVVALEPTENKNNHDRVNFRNVPSTCYCVVGGGGTEPGFIGVPVEVYTLPNM